MAVQLIRGVFHLDISIVACFRVSGVLFHVFLSFHSWSWWSRRQGSGGTTTVSLGGLVEHVHDVCLFQCWSFFSGNHNFHSWDYIPQVPDYQDFQLSDSGLEQFCFARWDSI